MLLLDCLPLKVDLGNMTSDRMYRRIDRNQMTVSHFYNAASTSRRAIFQRTQGGTDSFAETRSGCVTSSVASQIRTEHSLQLGVFG